MRDAKGRFMDTSTGRHWSGHVYHAQILSYKAMSALTTSIVEVVDTYGRIPGTSAQTYGIVADAQARDTILMTCQRTNALTPQHIPHLFILSASKFPKERSSYVPCTRNRHIRQTADGRTRRSRLM